MVLLYLFSAVLVEIDDFTFKQCKYVHRNDGRVLSTFVMPADACQDVIELRVQGD